MAGEFSGTQFNNILQDLQQDLDEQLVPAMRETDEALARLTEDARTRISDSSQQVQQALEQARSLGESIRMELETLERTHLQAAEQTRDTLIAATPPIEEGAASVTSSSEEVQGALGNLESAFPQFTDRVASAAENLTSLIAKIDQETLQGAEQMHEAARAVDALFGEQAKTADAAFADLARSCDEMTALSAELTGSHATLCAEELSKTATELKEGVRDAAEAANSAANLVLEGLEVFAGANEQMKNLFGDRSDEVLGTVRRIADLVESIRPFIEIAKSI